MSENAKNASGHGIQSGAPDVLPGIGEAQGIDVASFPAEALELIDRLEAAGFEAWVVGGAVRDGLLGKHGHDVDVTTDATPAEIERVFADRRTVDVGKTFGTIRVVLPGGVYEVTTYRAEKDYRDGRHPEVVAFSKSIEEDLQRRDFTMNAMAWHPVRGLLDLYDGRGDLARGVLRAVGRADERIAEDGLRMLRAVRFAARFGLALDGELLDAIRSHRADLSHISAERCYDELERMLTGQHPAASVDLLDSTGLWEVLFPSRPVTTVWRALLCAVPPTPALRWAALGRYVRSELSAASPAEGIVTKDVAAPEVRSSSTFAGWPAEEAAQRQKEAAGMRKTLRALKSSVALQKAVTEILLVPEEALPDTPLAVRHFVGWHAERLEEILTFWEAEANASQADGKNTQAAQESFSYIKEKVKIIQSEHLPTQLKDLAVSGSDLMAWGIPAGKELGAHLAELLERVMAERLENTPAALAEYAKAAGWTKFEAGTDKGETK